jgi:hypothetical protein
MTSDKYGSVLVADILASDRQRKDLGDLSDMAGSFGDYGQMQAVMITSWKMENGLHKLVYGGRRLGAAMARGDKYIEVKFTDERDPIKLDEMEFVENEQRQDISWLDRMDAVVHIHEERVARHGSKNWLKKQTAKRLGVSPGLVSDYLGITELVRKGRTKLRKCPDLGAARTMMSKILKQEAYAHDEEMGELLSPLIGGYEITPKSEIPIITADFCEWVQTYTGPKFNFFHCDFPYGIRTNERGMGSAIAVHDGGYDDSPETYWTLLKALCDNLDRICEDSAHIMFWFSMHYYAETLAFFKEHSDFQINPFPLIWVKPGSGLPGDYMREPRHIYETCLFGSRGGRVLVASGVNAHSAPTDTSDHPTAKPYDMLRKFFPMFVNENTKMLDPTCGSGTALRAAKSLGAEYVLGIEKKPEFVEGATLAFEDWVRANGNGQIAPDSPTAPL